MTLEQVLETLYKLEINCEISSFFDGGWSFKIGDKINGYTLEDSCYSLGELKHHLAKVTTNMVRESLEGKG